MSGLPLACVLLLACTYGGVGAASPAYVIKTHLGCTKAPDVNTCLTTRFSDLLTLGRFYLITVARKVYGGVGTDEKIMGIAFSTKKAGQLTISGKAISVIGLNTTAVDRVTLYKNTLKLSMVLPKLIVTGIFIVKFPPVHQKLTLQINIVNLRVMATAIFGQPKKLVVNDVKVSIQAEKLRVKIYENPLLDALVSHWVNDNKILNTKTLPWLAKFLEGKLKKILQKYVSEIK